MTIWNRILCLIGIHRWDGWHHCPSDLYSVRFCKRCDAMEER